jgi:hypothetical protein
MALDPLAAVVRGERAQRQESERSSSNAASVLRSSAHCEANLSRSPFLRSSGRQNPPFPKSSTRGVQCVFRESTSGDVGIRKPHASNTFNTRVFNSHMIAPPNIKACIERATSLVRQLHASCRTIRAGIAGSATKTARRDIVNAPLSMGTWQL